MTPIERLQESLKELKISLNPGIDEKLLKFLDLVLEANKTMNLTSIEDPGEAVSKHLVDSLSVLMLKTLVYQLNGARAWTDVGSGAGFPGMALALAQPQAQVHLLESTGKKAYFLETTTAQLGLMKQVKVLNARAEALCLPTPGARSAKSDFVPRGTGPSLPSLRANQDAVFFRGVSKLASLVELGIPLLKVGGLIIAYKGPRASEELVEAKKAMGLLKAELVEKLAFNLPIVNEPRVLLVLRKTGETSKNYPRGIGTAQKEPLI
jgi:16S rRNA (guanine527-N7)-methyltransferase